MAPRSRTGCSAAARGHRPGSITSTSGVRLGIEHRLTRPRRPQTNGMGEVFERERSSLEERFNGRIADLLRTLTSAPAMISNKPCTAT